MIVDRYAPQDLFALVPKLLLDFEPELRALDRLLDDDDLVRAIKADLGRRAPQSLTRGRHSTPVEVVLRVLVVKRLYGWSYEELEHFVGDSLVLRQFCRLYLEPVPDDTTLIRWAHCIGPRTLERLTDRVVELARSLKVTRGRKLRVDSTVVETTIHHPSDSGLLGDGGRVLSRLLRRAKTVVGHVSGLSRQAFRTRTRSVRRLAQTMHRLARRPGGPGATAATTQQTEQMKAAYRRLVGIAQQTCRQARQVSTALQAFVAAAPPPEARPRLPQRLVAQFEQVLPHVQQGIGQAVRRMLLGEAVPAQDKLVSLFEPHTQIIVRHKAGKPVEFGRKLWLDEVDGGIVSGYRLLPAPGQDAPYLAESLAAHQHRVGHPPWLLAGDRGVSTPRNERLAREAGVRRIILPANGKPPPARRAQEHTRWFRRGFRFRAGIEGRISVLRRHFGLDRCPEHGEVGMGRWIGWGIVTANLAKVAQTQAARGRRAVAAA